jgi:hypothetical protein
LASSYIKLVRDVLELELELDIDRRVLVLNIWRIDLGNLNISHFTEFTSMYSDVVGSREPVHGSPRQSTKWQDLT